MLEGEQQEKIEQVQKCIFLILSGENELLVDSLIESQKLEEMFIDDATEKAEEIEEQITKKTQVLNSLYNVIANFFHSPNQKERECKNDLIIIKERREQERRDQRKNLDRLVIYLDKLLCKMNVSPKDFPDVVSNSFATPFRMELNVSLKSKVFEAEIKLSDIKPEENETKKEDQ